MRVVLLTQFHLLICSHALITFRPAAWRAATFASGHRVGSLLSCPNF